MPEENKIVCLDAGLNGGLAYRYGATLEDNPFDKHKNPSDWATWYAQYKDEQNRRVGKI